MIRALFFSEFDNRVGPMLSFQAPAGYLKPDVFDGVADYIITKTQLVGKIVTITTCGHKVMGYPLRVQDDKYHRNALMFNVGMVFDEGADTTDYETVLTKLGNTFHTMETECSFLSEPTKKAQLAEILPKVLSGLQRAREVVLPVDEAHMLFLTAFSQMPPPPPVYAHEVPVRVRSFNRTLVNGWDLALQGIVQHIDGVNYVARIAQLTEIELPLVKQAVRQLLYFGYITMLDIFQYSNIYATTPRLAAFAQNPKLLQPCVEFIIIGDAELKRGKPRPHTVIALYSKFRSGTSVAALCEKHKPKQKHGIDDRRFVAYGVMNGIIRRIHEYPVPLFKGRVEQLLPLRHRKGSESRRIEDAGGSMVGAGAGSAWRDTEGSAEGGGLGRPAPSSSETLLKICDGTRSIDEICCTLPRSRAEVRGEIEANENFVIVMK